MMATEAIHWEEIKPCCRETMKLHADFNAMMVCPTCKKMIKCFSDDKAFHNYLKFCKTRHKEITTHQSGNNCVIIFRAALL